MIMKLKMNVKRIVGVFALVLMLCCMGTTMVHAETSNFTLTVTRTGYGEDDISKKTNKAGGDAYENCFYAKPTYFNRKGRIMLQSVKKEDKSVCSDWVTASEANVRVYAYYRKKAAANCYYYMQGAYSSSSNNYSLTVAGKYTP